MSIPFLALGQSIQIVTTSSPPRAYLENGEVKGGFAEIVIAVLEVLNIETEIHFYPWARAYKMALEEDNVLIFPLGRIPKRENLFKWVGLLYENRTVLVSLKERTDITINAIEDAKKYKIGVLRGGIRSKFLLSNGFKEENVDMVTRSEQNINKLTSDRIDLWAANDLVGYYHMNMSGYPPDMFRIAYQFQQGAGSFLAFSKNTPDAMVEQFQNALDQVKQNGTYERIMTQYQYKSDPN